VTIAIGQTKPSA